MFTPWNKAFWALPLFSLVLFAEADKPKLSGTWDLDVGKSQVEHSPGAVELIFQEAAGKIKLTRTTHTPDGKDMVATFECVTGGPDCVFDEAGHKSKVSLWYQGPALVILKTDGPSDDEVSQWTLKTDKGTLQVEVSHITPTAKAETMVFTRKQGS